jgi:single-strand DNA-binding protein
MPSYNRVILAGHLTRDPETKSLANEKCVAKFSLACNRKFGDREDVTFVDCEAWGKTAELAGKYLTKGRACLIEGRLKMDQWEDKQTGAKRSRLIVVADSIQFLGSASDRQASAPSHGDSPQHETAPSVYDDEMAPF